VRRAAPPRASAGRPPGDRDRAPGPHDGPGAGESTLALRGVTKRYGRLTALSEVELDVLPGEMVALVGPNGSGKTTLLHLAAGLLLPSAGSVLVGAEIAGTRAAALATRFLPDRPASLGRLTADATLRLLTPTRLSPRRREEILGEVGLAGRGSARLSSMSLGMRQRLTIGAALLAGSDRTNGRGPRPRSGKLLLLDEPTTALDPDGRVWLWELLRQETADGAAVLLATHDLDAARAHASRIGRLERGVLRT
jgi:ABC-type multidrug transport system ATPase subunit